MFTMDHETIFTDTQVASMRMMLAGGVLLPFAFKALHKIRTWKEFAFLFVVGFFGNFLPSYLFTYAETGISSGYAGMLNSCTPIFTVLIGFFAYKVRLTTVQVIGLIIGTVGLILLMAAGNNENSHASLIHVLAIVLATLMYAVSMTTIKHHLQQFKAFEITALSLGIVLFPGIAAFFAENTTAVFVENQHAWEGFAYISVLGVVGTAFAVIIFNRIITLRDPLFASSVTYFIPIVAVFIGYAFQEQLTLAQVASMFIVLIGVFFANYYPTLKEKQERRKIQSERRKQILMRRKRMNASRMKK